MQAMPFPTLLPDRGGWHHLPVVAKPVSSLRPLGDVHVSSLVWHCAGFPLAAARGPAGSMAGTVGTVSAAALSPAQLPAVALPWAAPQHVPARLGIYRAARIKLFLLQSFGMRERGFTRRSQGALPLLLLPPALCSAPALPATPLQQPHTTCVVLFLCPLLTAADHSLSCHNKIMIKSLSPAF